jgi:surface polysaccharide O-acyltransferase-like enzyme
VSRIKSVDVMRVVAILAVIAIHTVPFHIPSSPLGERLDAATIVNQLARFAVPLFFVLSGYFWAQKFKSGEQIAAVSATMGKRLLFLFAAWSVIYIFPTNLSELPAPGVVGVLKQAYWNVASVVRAPFSASLQGTKRHLWFLIALFWSLLISTVLLRYGRERTLMLAALGLYLAGLAGKAYSDTPLGFYTDFNFRNGPFFSLIFFASGYFLQRAKPTHDWLWRGLALTCVGAILHLVEVATFHRLWRTSMTQDYVFGTYFFGIGTAMIALSNSRFLHFSRAAVAGSLVLGVYASHMIFLDLLAPLDTVYGGGAIWSLAYVLLVFVFSLTLAWGMSKFQLTKKLVG